MNKETDNRETATEELAVIIRQRAFNLMSTSRMMCSEACCDRGGWAAEHAARMILVERPELTPQTDQVFLCRKDSRISIMLNKILSGFFAMIYNKR